MLLPDQPAWKQPYSQFQEELFKPVRINAEEQVMYVIDERLAEDDNADKPSKYPCPHACRNADRGDCAFVILWPTAKSLRKRGNTRKANTLVR